MVASTSVFVSCKDYDDDINKNSSDIAALRTQLTTLQNALDQAKSDANTAHAAYATASSLEEAKSSLESEISTVKTSLLNLKNSEEKDVAELQSKLILLEAELAKLKQQTAEDYLTKAEAAKTYALQTEVANLVKAEALQSAITALEAEMQAAISGTASAEKLNEIANQITAIDARLVTVESWKNRLEALETALPICQQQIANQEKALQQLIEILLGSGGNADAARAAVAAIGEGGLDAATLEELQKKMQDISDVVDNAAPNANIINAFVTHELKSIVLNPDYYINGIEAVTIPALKKYQLWLKGTNNEYAKETTGSLNVSLSGVAEYHLNPSSANILDYKLSFFGNKSVAITRSGENYVKADSSKITDYYLNNVTLYKKATGMLKVGFKADVDKIAKLAADELPMIALEMTKGDTIVTSDFAMVEPLEYTNFVLADKEYLKLNKDKTSDHLDDYAQKNYKDINNEHLHTVWRELVGITDNGYASNDPLIYAPTVKMVYNTTLDLKARVATHYDSKDVKGVVTKDKTLSEADFLALGLVYKFEAVDYTVGTNKTGESKHIIVDEKGVVTPYAVDESGKPTTEFNRAAIGKLPIVRVRLENGNGKVLAIGYYKIEIVDEDEPTITPETPKEDAPVDITISNTFYGNCSAGAWLTKTLTWSEVEAMVYAKLNLSKEEFEANYEIQPALGTPDADQYTYKVENGENKYTKKSASQKIGIISEVADDNNPTTNILKWEIFSTPTDWLGEWSKKNFKYLYDANNKVTAKVTKENIETCICFKNKKNDKSLYVRFIIPAGQIHFATAEATSTKALAQWFQQFNSTNATGDADAYEVATAVGNPTQTYQAVLAGDFKKDLHNYFLANQLSYKLTEASHFSAFAGKTPEFQFTTPQEASGNSTKANEANGSGRWDWQGLTKKYTLQLDNTLRRIQVYAVNGTPLSTPVDIITLNTSGEVQYLQNDYADDLLNGYGRSQRSEREAITAFVKIVIPNACYPLDMTGTEYFNVRFIRPVNLMNVNNATLKDAPNFYQYVDLASLVTLQDWRNYECVPGTQVLYTNDRVGYPFYDIQIRSDINDVMTDAHLGSAERGTDYNALKSKLTKYSNIDGIKLDIVNTKSETATPDPDGNILRYNYNGSELGTFHLFVPVYVKYVFAQNKDAWQHAYAVITVSATTK